MTHIVFLNSARLSFDQQLDFTPLASLGTFTSFEASTPEEIIQRVQGQDVVITKELPLEPDLISQFPLSVRLICEAGTGYDNISLDAACAKGITVCNSPGYSTEAVAQLAISFILALSTSLCLHQTRRVQGDISNFTDHVQLTSHEITGKTLGIVGLGTIGQTVARHAVALGMKVIYFSRTQKQDRFPELAYVPLEQLLSVSDFVSLHCPLTPETHHLVNVGSLRLMKKTTVLINTSRGGLVDENALVRALQEDRIAGAALDVLNPEPPSPDSPLLSMENVILTPHIGWKGLETRQRLVSMVADTIAGFVQGTPRNVVASGKV
ncbi:hydroxyacid dehydrogenase [Candidatus Wirthbacteria bacterium CG2_30_54_11]|uniref:Hydroxyacid dehydrogenase n=1 Tax=Candidatus Wirthbacteria bacterium CG2_30_54_11 TaxID=1817892 RepID=A0A1J5IZJ0_9BACT|nr:MAG: hydroxyacid dehydrogenase [Candidatus Wirthbacteria bacterium CG2_30_54_11]